MTDTATRYARYTLIDRLQAEGHLRNAILAGRHDRKLTDDDRADAARAQERERKEKEQKKKDKLLICYVTMIMIILEEFLTNIEIIKLKDSKLLSFKPLVQ